MIGNDIVDLKIAALESNWKRPRFLDKVFSKQEQSLIINSEIQSQMVWLLWSMKEAAYKIYVQQYGERIFNPKKLTCELISTREGSVNFNGNQYVTKSEIGDDFVNTMAYSEEPNTTIIHRFKIEDTSYKTQSHAVKQKLLKSFSELKKIPLKNLEIKNDKNSVPRLFHNGIKQSFSFSIAHHGFYGAYAISINSGFQS
jgi:phosphopantetheinyl transferase (holo-ACP synthase)